MRTALVGSNGYIAGYIFKRFEEDEDIKSVLRIDQDGNRDMVLDLRAADQFDYSVLDEIDYVVFTAAISGPDKCADDFDMCWNINVTGTSYFIKEAIHRKCRVLFFSSDAAFGDIPGVIYDEESATAAITPYGRMKKAIEDEFKKDPYFKAIRLSYVASAKDRFVTYCLDCIRNKETADIFHPFYRNVITVSDVVDVVMFFAKHWNEYEPTFLNVAGEELVSRIRIADEINRFFGNKLVYTVSRPENSFFANRPSITQMKSLHIREYKILTSSTFTEKFQKELEEIEL